LNRNLSQLNDVFADMFFVSQSTTLSVYQSSHEVEVLSSSPIELIRLLYKGALDAVEKSRLHLANGRIRERSGAITKAALILDELTAALDIDRGGKLAVDLRELYDYMRRRLTQANIDQTDPPLAEVVALLTTLYEAWNQINPPHLLTAYDVEDVAEIGHNYSC
jgi:flagellar protein FliS